VPPPADTVTLRPSVEADVDALVALLAGPGVMPWWGTNTAADVRQELHLGRAILVDGEIAGWLLVHEELEPDYRHAALDIALADRFRGRGIGRRALRTVIAELIAAGHHRFTIDPAVANEAAIRAYAAVGFREVGILRQAERAPDGVWRDALLMELLADELR
jgi:aminoglycoside 6'-N-acetyltransferase